MMVIFANQRFFRFQYFKGEQRKSYNNYKVTQIQGGDLQMFLKLLILSAILLEMRSYKLLSR